MSLSFRLPLAATVAFVVVLATSAASAAPGPTITISNFTFGPMEVSVPAGATVTWVNGDDVPHTVRSVDGVFHSKPLDSDERFSFTFTKPGVYSYFCSIHPRMTAKVIVR
jgi:plastocyanin